MAKLYRLDIKDPTELGMFVILHEMIPFEVRNTDICFEKVQRTMKFFKKHQDKIVAVAVRGKLGLIGIHWGIYETSDEFQIMGLFVKKGWRKFGYARMLKSYLEDNLLCGTRISTQVDITNIKMNNLNLSSGYMPSKIGNNQTTYFKVI